MAHGLLVGVRVTIDEIDCPHDHAGCTEAALQPMMLAERFLHRMQFFFRPDAFDCRDLCAVRLDGQNGA